MITDAKTLMATISFCGISLINPLDVLFAPKLWYYLFIKLEVLRGGFVVLRLEVSILSRDSTYNSLRQNQDYLAFYTLFLTNKAKSINQITK